MNKLFICITVFFALLQQVLGENCRSAECCETCCSEALQLGQASTCASACTDTSVCDETNSDSDACVFSSKFLSGDPVETEADVGCCTKCKGFGSCETNNDDDELSGGIKFLISIVVIGVLGGIGYFIYLRHKNFQTNGNDGGPPKATANKMFVATPSLGESAGPLAAHELEASSTGEQRENSKPSLAHYTADPNDEEAPKGALSSIKSAIDSSKRFLKDNTSATKKKSSLEEPQGANVAHYTNTDETNSPNGRLNSFRKVMGSSTKIVKGGVSRVNKLFKDDGDANSEPGNGGSRTSL